MSDHRALLLGDAQGLRTHGGMLASNTRQLSGADRAGARAPREALGTLPHSR